MSTNQLAAVSEAPDNIVQILPQRPRARQADQAERRFKVVAFTNRTGSQSWRVTGTKRDGTRIRDNYTDSQAALNRQIALEAEFHARPEAGPSLRATSLSDIQTRIAEAAFARLDSDNDMLNAVDHWLRHGRQLSVVSTVKLDEAVKLFLEWLGTPDAEMRDPTKDNLRKRVNVFANSVPNLELSSITPKVVSAYLEKRTGVTRRTKINDRLALSRFFAWCKGKEWLAINPAAKEGKSKRHKTPLPKILSVDKCKQLLRAAEEFKDGRLVPYVTVCLFGGLRPFEARRLTWDSVNITDKEIHLADTQTKTGKARTVKLVAEIRIKGGAIEAGPDTFLRWLQSCKGKPFYPSNWRKDFDALKEQIGFGTKTETHPDLERWPEDLLRHTAATHFVRLTGSYADTADMLGNSEDIIKAHYNGRVSSTETERFYKILPTKKGQAHAAR